MNLFLQLIKKINANLDNNFNDNYDYVRFGSRRNKNNFIKHWILNFLQKKGFYRNLIEAKALEDVLINAELLNNFYDLLSDEISKSLFIDLLAFRLIGANKIRLPLSNANYWKGLKEIEELVKKNEFIDPKFMNFILFKTDITSLGFPIQLYFTPGGIYTDFVLKQYEYRAKNICVEAGEGETVIDAGACWGDTALYFAGKVGVEGRVYSFEFIPSNLDIFNRNIALNPMFKDVVEVTKKPLWDYSGKKLFFRDNGPGSRLSEEPFRNTNDIVETITIDDFVAENKIAKIDFIKMDIEGAEFPALKGAIETIERDKPQLAIAIYHSISDMGNIPIFLNNLNLGYKFYIGHYTIHSEETILFAKVN